MGCKARNMLRDNLDVLVAGVIAVLGSKLLSDFNLQVAALKKGGNEVTLTVRHASSGRIHRLFH